MLCTDIRQLVIKKMVHLNTPIECTYLAKKESIQKERRASEQS